MTTTSESETAQMLAFTDTAVTKEKLIASLTEHRRLDHIVQGHGYWQDGKGCAVGCSLVDFGFSPGDHAAYEPAFGVPAQLAHLEDGLFESLPRGTDAAKEWPLRFADAITPGADLSTVWPRFAIWMLTDQKWGIANTTDAEDVKAICVRIADAYGRMADGVEISDAEAASITEAAWDARAARAARDARAARAARAARDAWDAWAARDAWDARAARAAWDAWDEYVAASCDKLIELLAAATPPRNNEANPQGPSAPSDDAASRQPSEAKAA